MTFEDALSGVVGSVDDVVTPSHLADVPADVVKIGRGLIGRLAFDERALNDTRAIVDAARALGRIVTAVGVEDDLSWRRVMSLGCDQAQGFVLAPALSTADLDAWRRRR